MALSNKPLPTRKIGDTEVTAIGYGAMGIGNLAYGEYIYTKYLLIVMLTSISSKGNAGPDEERFKVCDSPRMLR